MDEEPIQSAKPNIPTPDLPKPDLPLPQHEPAANESGATESLPAVNVRIREPGDGTDDSSKDGSIAPFNSRILAALIDMLITLGVMVAASSLLPHFTQKIAWLLGIGYLLTRDSLPFLGGQSVGKKVMKLRAVTKDDKPLTGNWEAGVIRNVILIPCFGAIELFVLLSREGKPEKGIRLGDEWAKTKVIVANPPPASQ